MRILYQSRSVVPSNSANSVHVMQMSDSFSNLGHEVALVAQKGALGEVDELFSSYGVTPSFELLWVRRVRRTTDYMSSFVQSALHLIRFKPHLVYAREIMGSWLAILLRYEVIYEAHIPLNRERWSAQIILGWLLKSEKLKRLVVISEALKVEYQKENLRPELEILVAADGAEQNMSEAECLGSENRLQVCYAGSLSSGRGLEIILELAERCGWADFHVFGGSPEDISRWTSGRERAENLSFYGFCPRSRILSALKGADVLMAPYQKAVYLESGLDTARYMSPLKVFEYMAAGKAIIASDIAALREVLEDGKTAILCNPEKIAEWEEALVLLRDDPVRRIEFGNSAQLVLREKYTWLERAQKVLTF